MASEVTDDMLKDIEQRLREGLPDLEERLRRLEECKKVSAELMRLEINL